MIIVVLVSAIESVLIASQTDASATTTDIILATMVLLFGGVFLLDTAYIEWKLEVNYFITLVLTVIGIVGCSASLVFHNTLVDTFFPRT